jgi:fatty acid desaturase
MLETSGMAAFWTTLGVLAGAHGAVFGIVIPFIVANIIIMSYVVTNHMLCPLSERTDSLRTTLSVRTSPLFDLLHLHFSHHVEHHLFPSLSHRYYPLVRASLMRHVPASYCSPPHWKALRVLFTTPRVYDGTEYLVNPLNGRRVSLADVRACLVDAQTAT